MRKLGKNKIFIISGIFILAFTLRCIYLSEMRSSPLFDTPTMDAEYHDQWAKSILKGEDYTGGVFFRAPFYPYFLALIYKVFGQNYFTVRLIQFIIGSLSCVLIFFLGRKIVNRRTGIIAGVIASFYGVLIYFDGELQLPVMEVFLDLLFLLTYIRTREKPSFKKWILSGVCLGLSALVRPNILLVGAALLIWTLIKSAGSGKTGFLKIWHSKSLIYSGCLVLGTFLMILPFTLRNYVKGHDFVLISSQGGMNFYIGNNPQSDGSSAILPGGRATWWGSYEDAIRLAEKNLHKTLKPSEVSDYWYKQGLKFAVNHPFSFAKLILKKIALFWNGNELSNNKDFYFFARSVSLLKILIWRFIIYFPFGLVAPLALVGIFLFHSRSSSETTKQRENIQIIEVFLFVYMLSVILFFVTARYRVPVLPVLIIFGSYALDRIYSFLKQKQISEFGKYLLIFLVILVLINIEIPGYSTANPGQAYYTLGTVYAKKGNMAKAEEEYNKAVFYNPNLGNAYANLASIYGDQGKHDMALEYYQKALQSGADSASVYYNLGVEYYNHGDLDQALQNTKASLSLVGDDLKVHYLLGEVYLQKGMVQEATGEYRETVKYDPQNALAYYRLGTIYMQMGQSSEAIDSYENFIKFWKGDPVQIQNVQKLLNELKQQSP